MVEESDQRARCEQTFASVAAMDHSPKPSTPTASPATAEDWEQVRRSVAMLPPGAWAMKREQALQALASLIQQLKR